MRKISTSRILRQFESVGIPVEGRKGTKLFENGQPVDGVLLVRSGKVQLKIGCPLGTDMVRLAGRGEILGLAALFCGRPHNLTAEVVSPAKVLYVDSEAFLQKMNEDPEVRMRVLEMLSSDLSRCYEQVRCSADGARARAAAC